MLQLLTSTLDKNARTGIILVHNLTPVNDFKTLYPNPSKFESYKSAILLCLRWIQVIIRELYTNIDSQINSVLIPFQGKQIV